MKYLHSLNETFISVLYFDFTWINIVVSNIIHSSIYMVLLKHLLVLSFDFTLINVLSNIIHSSMKYLHGFNETNISVLSFDFTWINVDAPFILY